jgi:anti-sigma factor RsiW
MHDIVIDELETHLSGGGVMKRASRAFYEHLDACPPCRAEIAEMDSLSQLLREMRPAEDSAAVPQPSLGFYSRVRYRIVQDQRHEAWGLFAPGAVFFRRIAFASLLLLAGLGSFLVSRESSFSGADAAAIMAQHDPAADHSAADRDRLLVTLAAYHE